CVRRSTRAHRQRSELGLDQARRRLLPRVPFLWTAEGLLRPCVDPERCRKDKLSDATGQRAISRLSVPFVVSSGIGGTPGGRWVKWRIPRAAPPSRATLVGFVARRPFLLCATAATLR